MKIAPPCVNTDGSAANSETCTCGSSECDATKGLFCLATSSKCTKSRANPDDSCVGCEDLVGDKSGIVWSDGNVGCAGYKTTQATCAENGVLDHGEGAANDKW